MAASGADEAPAPATPRQSQDDVLLAEAAEANDAPNSGAVDIYEDDYTMIFIKTANHHEGVSAADKTRVCRRAKSYRWAGDLLWRLMPDGSRRLVPLPAVRASLVEQAHSSAGHWGVRRTASSLAHTYWWTGLVADVRAVCRGCAACERRRGLFGTEPPLLNTLPVKGLFYRFGVDLAGPLPTTKSGMSYVMLAVDHFSKNLTTAALPNKEAATVAAAFKERVLCVYGAPAEVLTDQGTEFRDVFDRQLQEANIDHRTTTAYHPQANGLTERAVQSVKRALGKLAACEPDRWDAHLPLVTLGYNCSTQGSTGFAPYFLLHGVPPIIPPAIREHFSQPIDFDDPSLTANSLFDRSLALLRAMAEAGGNQLIAQHRDELRYIQTRAGAYVPKSRQMPIGSYVRLKVQQTQSLSARAHEGVYRVIEARQSGVLVLQGRCGGTFAAQIRHCTPCHLQVVDEGVYPHLARPSTHLACEVCLSPAGEKAMLICDGCSTGWHLQCLRPPLAAVPPGTWVCPMCVAAGLTAEQAQEHAAQAAEPAAPVLMRKAQGAHLKCDGVRVVKSFVTSAGDQEFEGRATYKGHMGKVALFDVVYEDGDAEVLTFAALRPLIRCPKAVAEPAPPEVQAPRARRRAGNATATFLSIFVAAASRALLHVGALPRHAGPPT